MESFPEDLKISKSAETLDIKGASVEAYLKNLELDLKEELERIMREEKMLGEGRAAQVFEVKNMPRSQCRACVKIWRNDLEGIRSQDFMAYRQIQSLDPEEEFDFQDKLYMDGFTNIPRPFAFTKIDDRYAMGMEKIQGYTLDEIKNAGVQIVDPSWKDLEKLLFDMNINYGALHRDIHEKNIMLQTDDDITQTKELRGKLIFVDFGHGKRISARPIPEDYNLTVGSKMVKYPQDKARVDMLKPNPRTPKNNVFLR